MLNLILLLVVKVRNLLQNPEIYLLTAESNIDSLGKALISLRNDDDAFKNLFYQAVEFCKSAEILIPTPRNRRIAYRMDDNINQIQKITRLCLQITFYGTADDFDARFAPVRFFPKFGKSSHR